jgi:hypothetical protein
MSQQPAETWVFRFEPLPHEVPSVHRVRSVLKISLRKFGLKCTAILELPPDSSSVKEVPSEAEDLAAEARILANALRSFSRPFIRQFAWDNLPPAMLPHMPGVVAGGYEVAEALERLADQLDEPQSDLAQQCA